MFSVDCIVKNACVQDWVLKFSDESAAQSWSDKTGDLLRPYPEKDTSKSLRKIGKHAILHHTVYNLTRFFVHQNKLKFYNSRASKTNMTGFFFSRNE